NPGDPRRVPCRTSCDGLRQGAPPEDPMDHTAHDHHAGYRDTRRHEAHGHPGDHAVHDHAHHADVAVFRRRFWVSLLLTIPTLVWSDLLQGWLGYVSPGFP